MEGGGSFLLLSLRLHGLAAFRPTGDGETRTLDPLLARQVLSQLSYTPIKSWHPPALPCRLQHSTIGRRGLNERVRDGNVCVPAAHRHQEYYAVISAPEAFPPQPLPLHLPAGASALLCFRFLNNSTVKQPLLYSLRKEVIQPHLPIRLPCYDFTPVTDPAFGSSLLAVGSLTSGVTDSHGVTGGVYKTRERIHRDMLIRDY